MTTITTPIPLESPKQSYLVVPEDELQRGRKRRRSSTTHTSSTGSANLRGRVRHRSLSTNNQSLVILEDQDSESPASSLKSPGKKYAKKYLEVTSRSEWKRRSQSPSRSRSLGRDGERKSTPKPRRRQRTRSRSRAHPDGIDDAENEGNGGTGSR